MATAEARRLFRCYLTALLQLRETFQGSGGGLFDRHGNLFIMEANYECRDDNSGNKRIVMDFQEVPQVDSSGLGTVVGLYVSARTRGCRLEIINASQQIHDLFSMTNLISLFEVAGRHHGKTI